MTWPLQSNPGPPVPQTDEFNSLKGLYVRKQYLIHSSASSPFSHSLPYSAMFFRTQRKRVLCISFSQALRSKTPFPENSFKPIHEVNRHTVTLLLRQICPHAVSTRSAIFVRTERELRQCICAFYLAEKVNLMRSYIYQNMLNIDSAIK